MSKVHIVMPDAHAHRDYNNDRALWLSRLIVDVKPDVFIDLGDTADLPSLSSYDKGKRSAIGRNYADDISAHNDFQDKLWFHVKKAKRKLPHRVRLIGNHEHRIEKALDLSPELEKTIGLKDLDLEKYYNEVVPYEGGVPGVVNVDGINYSHYFISGVLGRPIGGEHIGYSLITKKFASSTCGHTHTFDYCVRNSTSRTLMGLCAGVFQDYRADWAGDQNSLWHRGVAIKRNVEGGRYDLQWVGMDLLKKEYSK